MFDNGDGTAELQLDLDFIVAHPDRAGGPYRVAQAMLQFHEVFGLRFALDYVACSAGMSAFAIGGITRVSLRTEDDTHENDEREDMGPWRWRIDVGWPEGFLEFESTGFSQWLVGELVEQEAQCLAAADRL
ncbi:hypothetical protein [Lysobacter brunescens]|uniref:Integron gene cassette protein n=1 Tax=Lysobacter brunescens TaxID=262323 RepID=A0ABW2YDM3_9GAMM